MDHPKAKGDRTTLAVMLALHEVGLPFAIPFGENTRYDLIIDYGDARPVAFGLELCSSQHVVATAIIGTLRRPGARTKARSTCSPYIVPRPTACT
jgi:PD-(D/E)XK endonuclease